MNMKRIAMTAAAAVVAMAGAASAHTVSYGYLAGTNPGEVDFWFGSYHGNGGSVAGIPFESQLQLTGVNGTSYGPNTFSFTEASLSLPTGLVTGSNYFYADTATRYANDPSQVVSFMGVTVTGLNAGDYQFELQNTSSTTAFWQLWDNSIQAPFTLTSGNIGGGGTDPDPDPTSTVPLPAAAWLLLAGIGGMAAAGRRKKKAA